MNIIVIGFGCGFGGYAAYHLFTSALSDTLGLKTLRHGTGPCNYLSIQKNGARPDLGGKAAGESTLVDHSTERTANKFFVWDDDFDTSHDLESIRKSTGLPECFTKNTITFLHPLFKRLSSKFYCISGGVAATTIPDADAAVRIPLQILGGIGGLFTPVIDFHVTPEEFESQFQVDPHLVSLARYTEKPLSAWKYIGLSGVLYQGINTKVFSRIKNDPSRLMKGLAKMLLLTVLILSILSVVSTYGHVPGLINIYSLIAQATAGGTILLPLAAGCGIAIPFVCLAAS